MADILTMIDEAYVVYAPNNQLCESKLSHSIGITTISGGGCEIFEPRFTSEEGTIIVQNKLLRVFISKWVTHDDGVVDRGDISSSLVFKPQGVTAEHLSKIWWISYKTS